MSHNPATVDESARLKALRSYGILDTPPEPSFDDLTYLVSEMLPAPVALISLVDVNRLWFKSHHGLEVTEGPREFSFCDQALRQREPLIVSDAELDPRFRENPMVRGEPHLRFYAGVPLINAEGEALGTLCAIDHIPRVVTARQIEALRRLAAQAVRLMELWRVEQARIRAAEHFQLASSAAGLGFWELDVAARTLHWDASMYRIYGRTPREGEAPYALWAGNLHADDRARAEQEVTEAIAGTRSFDTTFRIVRPDDEVRHIKAAARVVRDAEGQAMLMFGVNIDVTEATESRNHLAALLSESTALLSTLHEHALVSVADQAGRILEVNDAFCALSGYRREELIGRDHRIVNSGVHTQKFWKDMWRTVAGGASWRREVCNRARNGSLYWVDSMITPFRDPQTGSVKYISIRFNITPLKETQRQLMASEALLERAEALSGVGGIHIDLPSGRQTWTRQAFRVHEMTGDVAPTLAELDRYAPPESLQRLHQALAKAVATGESYDVETPMTTARGRPIWIRAVGAVEAHDGKTARVVGSVQDITARKLAETELRVTSERLALATQAAGMGVWEWDMANNTLHWDEHMYRLYGRTPSGSEETYALWADSLHPDDRERTERTINEYLHAEGTMESEFRAVWPNGQVRHLRSVGQVERDAVGTPRRMVGMTIDITQSKTMELQLVEAARYDKLTGLANRALFMSRLERAVQRVQTGEQRHYAVLFLDFDRFKVVNDTLGHDAGDELLRQIAQRLRHELRASDIGNDSAASNVVSRFGGDEFLLLINDLSAPADAIRIAERLLSALSPAYEVLGSEVHSSASIGIVTSEHSSASAEEAVSNADMAMYEAKRAGRGCSVVFNELMHVRLTRHVQVETSLRRAIGTRELSVVYQPIVELATGRLASAEALVRWQHPTLGAIPPSEFIPIAEESGLIISLDAWVLQEACRAMVQWRQQDPQRAPATISVNLSRAELALGQQLLDQLRSTLDKVGLPAQCLQLEITEREVVRNPVASRKLMEDLRNLGVKLAMDDFGTGTSSLGFLRDYAFDTIKVDRAFVQGLSENPDVLAVIHATINLVENLHMSSLVEGVEDAAQVAILQSLGCRFAQGFLFSEPVPPDQLLGALEAQAVRAAQAAKSESATVAERSSA